MSQVEFGKIPPVLAAVSEVLARKVERDGRLLQSYEIPIEAGDQQKVFERFVERAHLATRAATDLRALWTAYALQVHVPKPVISRLGRAQGSSRQGVVRRFNDKTVAAIEELFSDAPDVFVIKEGLPSLTLDDLRKIPSPIADAAELVRSDKVGRARFAELERSSGAAVDGS